MKVTSDFYYFGVAPHEDHSWKNAKSAEEAVARAKSARRSLREVVWYFSKGETPVQQKVFRELLTGGHVKPIDLFYKDGNLGFVFNVPEELKQDLLDFFGVPKIWMVLRNGRQILDCDFEEDTRFADLLEKLEFVQKTGNALVIDDLYDELAKTKKYTHFKQEDFSDSTFWPLFQKLATQKGLEGAFAFALSDYLSNSWTTKNGKDLADAVRNNVPELVDFADEMDSPKVFSRITPSNLRKMSIEDSCKALNYFADNDEERFVEMCKILGDDKIASMFYIEGFACTSPRVQAIVDEQVGEFVKALESGKILRDSRFGPGFKTNMMRKLWYDPKSGEFEFFFTIDGKRPKSKEEYVAIYDNYVLSGFSVPDFCEMNKISSTDGFLRMIKRIHAEDKERKERFELRESRIDAEAKDLVFDIGRGKISLKEFFDNIFNYQLSLSRLADAAHEMDRETGRRFLDKIVNYYHKRLNEAKLETKEDVKKLLSVPEFAFLWVDKKKSAQLIKENRLMPLSGSLYENVKEKNGVGARNELMRYKFHGNPMFYEFEDGETPRPCIKDLLVPYEKLFNRDEFLECKNVIMVGNKEFEITPADVDAALEYLEANNIIAVPMAVRFVIDCNLKNALASSERQ